MKFIESVPASLFGVSRGPRTVRVLQYVDFDPERDPVWKTIWPLGECWREALQ